MILSILTILTVFTVLTVLTTVNNIVNTTNASVMNITNNEEYIQLTELEDHSFRLETIVNGNIVDTEGFGDRRELMNQWMIPQYFQLQQYNENRDRYNEQLQISLDKQLSQGLNELNSNINMLSTQLAQALNATANFLLPSTMAVYASSSNGTGIDAPTLAPALTIGNDTTNTTNITIKGIQVSTPSGITPGQAIVSFNASYSNGTNAIMIKQPLDQSESDLIINLINAVVNKKINLENIDTSELDESEESEETISGGGGGGGPTTTIEEEIIEEIIGGPGPETELPEEPSTGPNTLFDCTPESEEQEEGDNLGVILVPWSELPCPDPAVEPVLWNGNDDIAQEEEQEEEEEEPEDNDEPEEPEPEPEPQPEPEGPGPGGGGVE